MGLLELENTLNDANLIDFDTMTLCEDGTAEVTGTLAFIKKLSPLEQFSLLEDDLPTLVAQHRLHCAMLYKAYRDLELVKRYLKATSQDQTMILSALLYAAPAMYQLQDVPVRYDIRRIVIPAILDLLQQLDRTNSIADLDLMTIDLFAPEELGAAAMEIKKLFVKEHDAVKIGSALTALAENIVNAVPKLTFPFKFWNAEGTVLIRSIFKREGADTTSLTALTESLQ